MRGEPSPPQGRRNDRGGHCANSARKPEALPKKENRDEGQNDNRDERVAAEKPFDQIICAPAPNGQRCDHGRRGNNFDHPLIMPPPQQWRQIPKCYD
jgi:hypothetical protein